MKHYSLFDIRNADGSISDTFYHNSFFFVDFDNELNSLRDYLNWNNPNYHILNYKYRSDKNSANFTYNQALADSYWTGSTFLANKLKFHQGVINDTGADKVIKFHSSDTNSIVFPQGFVIMSKAQPESEPNTEDAASRRDPNNYVLVPHMGGAGSYYVPDLWTNTGPSFRFLEKATSRYGYTIDWNISRAPLRYFYTNDYQINRNQTLCSLSSYIINQSGVLVPQISSKLKDHWVQDTILEKEFFYKQNNSSETFEIDNYSENYVSNIANRARCSYNIIIEKDDALLPLDSGDNSRVHLKIY